MSRSITYIFDVTPWRRLVSATLNTIKRTLWIWHTRWNNWLGHKKVSCRVFGILTVCILVKSVWRKIEHPMTFNWVFSKISIWTWRCGIQKTSTYGISRREKNWVFNMVCNRKNRIPYTLIIIGAKSRAIRCLKIRICYCSISTAAMINRVGNTTCSPIHSF